MRFRTGRTYLIHSPTGTRPTQCSWEVNPFPKSPCKQRHQSVCRGKSPSTTFLMQATTKAGVFRSVASSSAKTLELPSEKFAHARPKFLFDDRRGSALNMDCKYATPSQNHRFFFANNSSEKKMFWKWNFTPFAPFFLLAEVSAYSGPLFIQGTKAQPIWFATKWIASIGIWILVMTSKSLSSRLNWKAIHHVLLHQPTSYCWVSTSQLGCYDKASDFLWSGVTDM